MSLAPEHDYDAHDYEGEFECGIFKENATKVFTAAVVSIIVSRRLWLSLDECAESLLFDLARS